MGNGNKSQFVWETRKKQGIQYMKNVFDEHNVLLSAEERYLTMKKKTIQKILRYKLAELLVSMVWYHFSPFFFILFYYIFVELKYLICIVFCFVSPSSLKNCNGALETQSIHNRHHPSIYLEFFEKEILDYMIREWGWKKSSKSNEFHSSCDFFFSFCC